VSLVLSNASVPSADGESCFSQTTYREHEDDWRLAIPVLWDAHRDVYSVGYVLVRQLDEAALILLSRSSRLAVSSCFNSESHCCVAGLGTDEFHPQRLGNKFQANVPDWDEELGEQGVFMESGRSYFRKGSGPKPKKASSESIVSQRSGMASDPPLSSRGCRGRARGGCSAQDYYLRTVRRHLRLRSSVLLLPLLEQSLTPPDCSRHLPRQHQEAAIVYRSGSRPHQSGPLPRQGRIHDFGSRRRTEVQAQGHGTSRLDVR
jgi:hypothetical protein